MMTATHTTVGWTVMNHADLATGDRYKGAYEIAEACEGEHEANQQLIGAALDLLTACEACGSACINGDADNLDFSKLGPALALARAAIARATAPGGKGSP